MAEFRVGGEGIGEHMYSTHGAGELGVEDKRARHPYSWGKPHQRKRGPTHTWCMTLDGQPLQSIIYEIGGSGTAMHAISSEC